MDNNSLVPMTPPNHFVKELRGMLDQQNILSNKTKQKGILHKSNCNSNVICIADNR